MSFTADDDLLTLEAALAFVDASYQDTGHAAESAKAITVVGAAVLDQSDVFADGEAVDEELRERRARNAVASNRSRRKKKTQLLMLREEAGLLQAQLDALAKRKRDGNVSGTLAPYVPPLQGGPGGQGAEAVQGEYRLRQKSEAMNRRLRAELRRQRCLAQRLAQMLGRQLEVKELEGMGITNLPPCSLWSSSIAPRIRNLSDERDAILLELQSSMESLVVEANACYAASAPFGSEFAESSTRLIEHPELGPCVEIASTTLLARSMDSAWNQLAATLGHYQRSNPDPLEKRRAITEQTYEKEYSMTLDCAGHRDVAPLDGVSLVHLADSADYHAYIWTAVVKSRDAAGVAFHVRGRVAMTRSAADPLQRCVYRQCIQLFGQAPTSAANAPTMTERGRPSTNCAGDPSMMAGLNALTAKMRTNQRLLEGVLLKKCGSGDFIVPPSTTVC